MTAAVALVVAAGLALAILYGAARGFDIVSVVLLVALGGFGTLGIAVARRAGAGGFAPRTCPECDGLVSHAAPYCNHCGASLGARED